MSIVNEYCSKLIRHFVLTCITHTSVITIHSTSLEDNTHIHIISYITMHNTSPDHIPIHITLHTYVHLTVPHITTTPPPRVTRQRTTPHIWQYTHHSSLLHKASTFGSSLYNAMPSYTSFLQDYKRRLIFSLVHVISYPQ